MRFVERDGLGKVKGSYAVRQSGYAEEELEDDHPDLVEFNTRPVPLAKDLVDEFLNLPPARRALLKAELAKP